MRRFFWLVLLPAGLAAQQPTVSPPIARLLNRVQDTTLSVWLFARPRVSLDALSQRVRDFGARIRVRSRWLHAISADVPAAGLRALRQGRDLVHIQPLGRFRVPRDRPLDRALVAPTSTVGADTCPAGGDPVYGPSEMPYRRLNLRPLSDRGLRGSGVRVLILDSGFDTENPAFSGVTVVAQHDFVFNDSIVRDQPGIDQAGAQSHGTAVWSLFAGNLAGRLRGIAPDATYLLAKTEDVRSETRVEEDNYVAALEWADSIGVDIASSSLAYLVFDNGFTYQPSDLNGDVAVTTVAVDAAAKRGITVVTAASNNGPGFRTLWTPADADSGLAIGAEDSLGNIASFSSRGPTADGRLKPDFTAPGVAVCVLTGPGTMLREAGTSFATPLTAAGIVLLKSLFPSLGPIAIRQTLRATASRRSAPDSTFGWGRPDFGAAAAFTGLVPLNPVSSPLTSITPAFAWTAGTLPAPVTFRLRVARDSQFLSLVADTTVGSATTARLPHPLKGTRIFWRVDARSDTGGDTASTGIVGPLAVPPWATLLTYSSPAGSVTDTAQPTFRWTQTPVDSPPAPASYDLIVQRVATNLPEVGIGGLRDTFFTLPQPLERNTAYRWSLIVHLGADTSLLKSQGSFLVVDGGAPTATLLYQNFPNPFPIPGRDSTCLWFDIASAGLVELDILDLRGNRVKRFVPGPDFPAILPAGRYGRGAAGGAGICDPRLMWDGRADDGHPLPAGVYLAKLKAAGLLVFKRIVFRGK